MENICQNCKHWEAPRKDEPQNWMDRLAKASRGETGKVDVRGICQRANAMNDNDENYFGIEASADDDSGLTTELKTGPRFGCVHFEARQ